MTDDFLRNRESEGFGPHPRAVLAPARSQTAATSATGADPAAASAKGPPVPQCSSFIRGGAATPRWPTQEGNAKAQPPRAFSRIARPIAA
jgi:hypothetical protein